MSKPKILIVDDERSIVTALQDAFTDCGFEVEYARSGAAAMARIGESPPDAVLLDKNMPGMSGVDVLREIRESSSSMVVVLITAYGSAASAMEALNIGVDAYIEKPFADIFQVVTVVREALKKRGRKLTETARTRSVLVVGADRSRDLFAAYLGSSIPISLASTVDEVVMSVKDRKPGFIAMDAGAFAIQDITALVFGARAQSEIPILVFSERPLSLPVLKTFAELGVTAVCDDVPDLELRIRELVARLPPA